MLRGSIDPKIGRGFAGPNDLRSDARVAWMQAAGIDGREVTSDSGEKLGAMAVIERIVDGIDPPDVGPEPGLPTDSGTISRLCA